MVLKIWLATQILMQVNCSEVATVSQ